MPKIFVLPSALGAGMTGPTMPGLYGPADGTLCTPGQHFQLSRIHNSLHSSFDRVSHFSAGLKLTIWLHTCRSPPFSESWDCRREPLSQLSLCLLNGSFLPPARLAFGLAKQSGPGRWRGLLAISISSQTCVVGVCVLGVGRKNI